MQEMDSSSTGARASQSGWFIHGIDLPDACLCQGHTSCLKEFTPHGEGEGPISSVPGVFCD